MWNRFLAPTAERLQARWAGANEGAVAWFPHASEHSFLIWADNLFLSGSDVGTLQGRIPDVWAAFAELRLEFSADSPEVIRGPDADPDATFSPDPEGPLLAPKEAMRVLGTMVDGVGGTPTVVRSRLRQAKAMLVRLGADLRAPGVPQKERMHRLFQTVGSCALYGAGLWTPSAALAREQEVEEMSWMRGLIPLTNGLKEDILQSPA